LPADPWSAGCRRSGTSFRVAPMEHTMTRAWNLSVAIAGLCGALLATPAAAEPNNPCAAVIGELRQVAADEKGSVSHMRGLQDDISHHLQDILTAQNYIRKYENVIHGLNDSGLTIFDKSLGMPDLKDAQEHLAEQQGRIQNLVSGMSKIQAELAVTSERLTAARNRHNALRQQLASPNCRTAGQRPVSPTDTASTPSGNPATASTAISSFRNWVRAALAQFIWPSNANP